MAITQDDARALSKGQEYAGVWHTSRFGCAQLSYPAQLENVSKPAYLQATALFSLCKMSSFLQLVLLSVFSEWYVASY